jgi:hypothetical protein
MQRIALLFAVFAFTCPPEVEAQAEIRGNTTYHEIPVHIAGRDYIGTADVFDYWSGARVCSAVVVFPAKRYLVHSMWVERGITIFKARGRTHHIRGRCIAFTDSSATSLKIVPGELPVDAYRSYEALCAAVTKHLATLRSNQAIQRTAGRAAF